MIELHYGNETFELDANENGEVLENRICSALSEAKDMPYRLRVSLADGRLMSVFVGPGIPISFVDDGTDRRAVLEERRLLSETDAD